MAAAKTLIGLFVSDSFASPSSTILPIWDSVIDFFPHHTSFQNQDIFKEDWENLKQRGEIPQIQQVYIMVNQT